MTVGERREGGADGEPDMELGFEAEFDGQVILFMPSSPYAAKLRRDDETAVWLAYVRGPKPSHYVDERVVLHRHATEGEVVDGYRSARHVRTLATPVRMLLKIAEVIYCERTWQAEAAADLAVSVEEIASWVNGEAPPIWLEDRLLALMPRLAFAQRRHGWLASLADGLIESLGSYDEARWRYPEPESGPDQF